IEGGARYLSDLIDMFPSDLRLVIAAYNAGENAVKRHGNKVPPIAETRDYVVRVLDYYNRMD
ncbi:MAG: lytic transglycosylase domain-containing protein, partial [Gammaproteobacteria bacterium]|nr:lytic transglycosylase domain-containing protein [Gammaproteobacteria bacterium]